MTEAAIAIIAACITALGAIVSALIGALIHPPKDKSLPPERKVRLWSYVIGGLVVGGFAGWLVGMIILNRPQPYARILASSVHGPVLTNQTISISYKNIPKDKHIWPVVQIPGIGNGKFIYPQFIGKEMDSGIFSVNMTCGGPKDSGRSFTYFVLLADDKANSAFEAYAASCKNGIDHCNGMVMPEEGVELLDFLPVIRQ
jgi:hypothetical protein